MAFLPHCAVSAEAVQRQREQREVMWQWRFPVSGTHPERLEETLPWLPGELSREPGMLRVPQQSNSSARLQRKGWWQGRSSSLCRAG